MKLLSLISVFLFSCVGFAQLKQQTSVYKSGVDNLLTVKKIAVLPSTDNVGGIYSRPIEATIRNLINKKHQYDLVSDENVGTVITPTELEADPSLAKKLVRGLNADAAIVSQTVKGPNGINIKLHLYLIKDGRMLAKEEIRNSKKFDTNEIKADILRLVTKALNKIPYDGIILSRDGNRVTINLGTSDGIKNGQTISVVQIIKATFHPKFNFLISTEKEILGKIKIAKAEKTLSFGKIISEIEREAIQKNAKLSGIESVSYIGEGLSLTEGSTDTLQLRPDNKISFGKSPEAWVPKRPPTFGAVSAGIGLGSFKSDVRRSGQPAAVTSDPLGKNISFGGELWITPKWNLHANLKQGIVSNQSSSGYDFLGGYMTRFGNDVWSPYVEVLAGYSAYSVSVEDVSSQVTKLTYSGLKFGVAGMIPVTNNRKWAAGAQLFMFLSPSLSQNPSGSSASGITANHFSIYGHYKLGEDLKATGAIDFELYSAKFSGATQSTSQSVTMLSGGVSYMF